MLEDAAPELLGGRVRRWGRAGLGGVQLRFSLLGGVCDQGGLQNLLGWLRGLGEGVALADGADEEACAVADALLGVEVLGVAQAPFGAVGDDEVPRRVAAHPLAHQALYGEHLLGGAGEFERLLPAGGGRRGGGENAGAVPVLCPPEKT